MDPTDFWRKNIFCPTLPPCTLHSDEFGGGWRGGGSKNNDEKETKREAKSSHGRGTPALSRAGSQLLLSGPPLRRPTSYEQSALLRAVCNCGALSAYGRRAVASNRGFSCTLATTAALAAGEGSSGDVDLSRAGVRPPQPLGRTVRALPAPALSEFAEQWPVRA